MPLKLSILGRKMQNFLKQGGMQHPYACKLQTSWFILKNLDLERAWNLLAF